MTSQVAAYSRLAVDRDHDVTTVGSRDRQLRSGNSLCAGSRGVYKTELCRPWVENGTCRYGKCQFAHGLTELRVVPRHPKYKTHLCRTFHSTGLCPYGPRCHFIHDLDYVTVGTVLSQCAARIDTVPSDVAQVKRVMSMLSHVTPDIDHQLRLRGSVLHHITARTGDWRPDIGTLVRHRNCSTSSNTSDDVSLSSSSSCSPSSFSTHFQLITNNPSSTTWP